MNAISQPNEVLFRPKGHWSGNAISLVATPVATAVVLAAFLTIVGSVVGLSASTTMRSRGEPDGNPSSNNQAAEVKLPRSYRLTAAAPLDYIEGERVLPVDLALGPDGTLFVADFHSHMIVVYNADGTERERWRHQLAIHKCGGVFVPTALSIMDNMTIVIMWSFFVADHADSRRFQNFIEVRGLDGRVASAFAVGFDFADMTTNDNLVYLVTSSMTSIRTIAGVDLFDKRLLISGVRPSTGSYAVLAADRVASIKSSNGAVLVQTVSPYTSKLVDIKGLRAIAVDADGGTLHVLATDEKVLFHVRVDRFGQVLSSSPISGIAFNAAAAAGWPLALAIRDGNTAIVSSVDQGLLILRLDPQDQLATSITGDKPNGNQIEEPSRRGWTACGGGVLGLSSATDEGLLVYDKDEQRIIDFDDQLRQERVIALETPLVSMDASGPAAQDLVMLTATDRLIRVGLGASADLTPPLWDVPCNCRAIGRIAWAGDRVVVGSHTDKSVRIHDSATGGLLMSVTGSSRAEVWPYDVALATYGTIFATDTIDKRIQRINREGAFQADLASGYAVGPRHLAVSDAAGAGTFVVTAMGDGFLELRDGGTGNLVLRWEAEEDGVPFYVADVVMDAQLRVYVLDGFKRVLYRFDPSPDEIPQAFASPTPSRNSCVVRGDKQAGPSSVVLGSTASITLSMHATCPLADEGAKADVILVADNSTSMRDVTVALRKALSDFGQTLDLRRHRVGLVTFHSEANLASALSHTRRDLGMLLPDPNDIDGGGSSYDKGITMARDHLLTEGDPQAVPILVLLGDGQFHGDTFVLEAQRTMRLGIQMFVIAIGSPPNHANLRQMASSPAHYFATWTPDDLYLIFERLKHQLTASRIGNLVITDEVSDQMDYVDGSAFPPASIGGARLTWGRAVLPSTGITLSLEVRPRRAGPRQPTNRLARAEYTDADGTARQFTFPVPYIDVITPSPTPTEIPTPQSPTPPRPVVFLPLLLREISCRPELRPLDVMLVIDASNSMAGAKLAAAKQAAQAFTEMLQLGKDRIGLVSFNTEARLESRLTTDGGAFLTAVERIALSAGTRLDSGLSLALGTMLSSPRSGALGAVVLLTDGRQDAEPQTALDAAFATRQAGMDLFTVGLGGDADLSFLRQLVDDPRKVRLAEDPVSLPSIYRAIAQELPCSNTIYWGGR